MKLKNITIINFTLLYILIIFGTSILAKNIQNSNLAVAKAVPAPVESSEKLSQNSSIDQVTIIELDQRNKPKTVEVINEDPNNLKDKLNSELNNKFSLDDLFVLDRLFDDGAVISRNKTTLGDLFVLERLFNDSDFILTKEEGLSLGELFVLDELFNGDNILDKGSTTISDLFILDKLFNR